ncbi:LOW QUALITY PROTEIN: zinc finger protein 598-like [Phalaenopsis equestris]|uniref:LOW QUALITY PROTEIN: zinc finger protein 598-like n=1 Tax=Phalaenopsis equestris TaxID=78828 RepID=UPI0009E18D9D|nr:LOW QUALITY PROTEIN: zinc finger protein 598-like [Phalaenopsis equestris]
MEDCCAVCAESLEWVAYGSCGHRDVCSTCVVRLRFVLSDRRCCICKTECPTVFITRALGNFTETKVNFSEFPPGVTEGQHGKYWYHEDSQAFFDDADHYKMISAMCRLSCSICEKNAEAARRGTSNKKLKFKDIEQLKNHLYHQHKMFMCNLCMEGRKIFISEQKLYSRSQLRQHISTGGSEVDGSESERGGFTGHPMCEFCKNPFYGDTELYMHMSREHFTCHICQRQHPGQYDYYRNYEDLETHFRQDHFLCESETCLAKKFVVFQTDAEMKRHNAIQHGGHMSRAKRNAALQIPISFRYRRNEQDQRRGRRRDLHLESSNNQLNMAIQASLETAISEGRLNAEHGEASQADEITSSMEQLVLTSHFEPISSVSIPANRHSSGNESILQEISFPPLSDFEPPLPSSRYAQVLNRRSGASLGEESFPPLNGVKVSSKPKPKLVSDSIVSDTIAARINPRNKGSVKILHSAKLRPVENYEAGSSASSSSHMRPTQISQPAPSSSSYARPWGVSSQVAPSSSSVPQVGENGFAAAISTNSAWALKNMKMKHSASAPNLHNSDSSESSTPQIVSSVTLNKEFILNYRITESPSHVDVYRANKSLVENIRAGLGMDENKYAAFRSISAEYRQSLINSWEYLSYVEQFGLSHLVLELAQLCPDPQKQKELIDAYNANLFAKNQRESSSNAAISKKDGKIRKGKTEAINHTENSSAKDALADSISEQVRKLQTSRYPPKDEDEVEILTKDGYRTNMVKIPSAIEGSSTSYMNSNVVDLSSERETISNHGLGSERHKKNKKTSKFNRVRLGDGSAAAYLDLCSQQTSPENTAGEERNKRADVLPAQGVWGKGGGKKLFTQTGTSK